MSPMQRADSSSAVGYEMVGTTKKSRAYGDGDEEADKIYAAIDERLKGRHSKRKRREGEEEVR